MAFTRTRRNVELPEPVVTPGTLPSWLFDQDEFWIDTEGFQHHIDELDRETVEFVISYLFSYASLIRSGWSMETKQTFDVKQKPRRWLLTKPGPRALFERFVLLNKAEEING